MAGGIAPIIGLPYSGGEMAPSDSSDSEERSCTRGGGRLEGPGYDGCIGPYMRAAAAALHSAWPADIIDADEGDVAAAPIACGCTLHFRDDLATPADSSYVRPGQPRSGRAQTLGATTMGARS